MSVLLIGTALARRAVTDIGDLDPDRSQTRAPAHERPRDPAPAGTATVPADTTTVPAAAPAAHRLGGEEHPQHGRTAGVHHGVGDEFGNEQNQRLSERLVGSDP
ncbi:hypothetical protein J5X86_06455 [Streptomyces sp. NEAU-YJ-81]|nr:hypothetical protein [Streptomyces sp. NEAU-YJ-81]